MISQMFCTLEQKCPKDTNDTKKQWKPFWKRICRHRLFRCWEIRLWREAACPWRTWSWARRSQREGGRAAWTRATMRRPPSEKRTLTFSAITRGNWSYSPAATKPINLGSCVIQCHLACPSRENIPESIPFNWLTFSNPLNFCLRRR